MLTNSLTLINHRQIITILLHTQVIPIPISRCRINQAILECHNQVLHTWFNIPIPECHPKLIIQACLLWAIPIQVNL